MQTLALDVDALRMMLNESGLTIPKFKVLHFNHHVTWKTSQRFFTKMVVADPDYYKINEVYDVLLMSMPMFFAQLVSIKPMKYYDITDFEAYTDLGIPLKEYREYLLHFLPKNIDLQNQVFYLCLFEHCSVDKDGKRTDYNIKK